MRSNMTAFSFAIILLASAPPLGYCQHHLDISSTHLQQLHDEAAAKQQGSGRRRHGADRNLQIQNPCAYVKLGELESTYRTATGVEFDCSCQALGFSNSGQTVCEAKEPFCCSSSPNFDEDATDMECQVAKEIAMFRVVPFSGYFVPRPVTTTVCMRFTGDDDRLDSEACKTNEFSRDAVFDGSFTCEAKFNGSLCSDCTQCDGSDGAAYDCSNVARSSNLQVSCDSKRTCRAQSGAKGGTTEAPTESPSKSPISSAPTMRPTPASGKENILPASEPTQSDSQSEGNGVEENTNEDDAESELVQKIKGPQSLLCTNGSCILSDEDAAQQCNFYALSRYGDANFDSNGRAVVESINTSEGPIDIKEGCVMKCKGCYLVLSPDDSLTASAGFTSKTWSTAGSMIVSLAAFFGLF